MKRLLHTDAKQSVQFSMAEFFIKQTYSTESFQEIFDSRSSYIQRQTHPIYVESDFEIDVTHHILAAISFVFHSESMLNANERTAGMLQIKTLINQNGEKYCIKTFIVCRFSLISLDLLCAISALMGDSTKEINALHFASSLFVQRFKNSTPEKW